MNEKNDSSWFYLSFCLTAIFITIIIATGIFASSLILYQNQSAIAQQQQQQQQLLGSNSSNQTLLSPAKQQQPFVSKDISFDIDNVTFSQHMASVNGIQIHYVIGGQGKPVVLLYYNDDEKSDKEGEEKQEHYTGEITITNQVF
jgi:hypothetical protein